MQHRSLATQDRSLASITRTLLPHFRIAFSLDSHLYFEARSLLSFFLRPKVTRTLNDSLSVEIENLRQAPGLCYIRFYDRRGRVSLPSNLLCVDLLNSTLVRSIKDASDQPAFLVVDIPWHAICQGQTVLAYVHASGAIFLPNEVVS